ncbi:MAG TPA: hypothetical protein VGX48_19770 [Pyrinomonadaceae bacterium]|jgi:hypothetical protein|nr:hypothetical protein [Pyrinomonadaceae bacterium]
MYDTSGSRSVCDYASLDYDVNARINWLKGELARAEWAAPKPAGVNERAAARRAVPLGRAFTPSEAYAWFGAFLGLLPPAAIFGRFLYSLGGGEKILYPLLICVSMTAVCGLVGRAFAAHVGRLVGEPHRRSWPFFLFGSLLLALLWGLVTGAAGGAVCFGFGALFGPLFAVPVALAAFPVFATFHRLLSRGGMIEARSLWPLAYGIPGVIAATILSIK